MENIFYFLGRPDGIGNRIEQLINIQEYCEANNMKCIYIWRNSSFRNYNARIEFENIEIRTSIKPEEEKYILNNIKNILQRTFGHKVKYKFNFTIDNHLNYDVIIHIRGTDRIVLNKKNKDFSTIDMLNSYINKTIEYVNNDESILTYTVVTDDIQYKKLLLYGINKRYVELIYNYKVNNDWLDFYYLTTPQKYIIMCSQFSSYSICASILGDKKIKVFKNSLSSNLSRYNANISIIDE